MKDRRRRLVAGLSGLALSGTALLVSMGSASADTGPGWEPDPNSIGSITFYNSSGTVITGGNLSDKPFAAYAVASHAAEHGDDNHAQLYAFTPQEGGTNPQLWSGDNLSASAFSPTPDGTPAAVSASGNPFVVGTSGDLSMTDYIGEYPNNLTDAGYTDLYEMRLFSTGPTQTSPDTSEYDSTDISVDTMAGTWSVVTTLPDAPTLNGDVTISGTARVGSTVKCNAAYTGADSVTYAWKIGTSTVSSKQSFAIPAADYNKSLTCVATGTNAGGSTPGTSASKKVAKGPALKAATKPKATGKYVQGKTLKVSHGSWSPAATKYAYQWTANGKAIKGASKSSLKLAKAEVGKKVGCTVTAEKTGYTNGVAKTTAVKVKKKKK